MADPMEDQIRAAIRDARKFCYEIADAEEDTTLEVQMIEDTSLELPPQVLAFAMPTLVLVDRHELTSCEHLRNPQPMFVLGSWPGVANCNICLIQFRLIISNFYSAMKCDGCANMDPDGTNAFVFPLGPYVFVNQLCDYCFNVIKESLA